LRQPFITELAESDLTKIWLYIARDKPQAADRFVDELRAQCEKLAAQPDLGRPRPDLAAGIRSYRVGNYLIFYFPTATGVEVARVLHGARDLPKLF
jgi:toxin ParE1/3/4